MDTERTAADNRAMRIQSLDVLRGLALLGMCVVHFHEKSSEPGGFDNLIRTLVWRLVETKSHGTFALLFGAGFAIQMRRREDDRGGFVAPYLRRLGVLACFGCAAHALFGYNVLLGYATWGVALLAVRTWPTRALVAVAVGSAMSVALYYSAFPANTIAAAQVYDALRSAEAQDSYAVLLDARLRHMAWFYTQPFFFMPGATLTLFIVGVLFVRHRVFEQIGNHRPFLIAMAAFGIAAWLGDNGLLERVGVETTLGILRDQWLTFSYVAGVLLLLDRTPALLRLLGPVADAGRMALTNYLLQIVLLDLLFSGYSVGVGQVRPVVGVVLAVACFAAEAAISSMWLARFRYGPAEWLWRALTYGRRPPAREQPASNTDLSRSLPATAASRDRRSGQV